MDLAQLSETLQRDAGWVVFLNVLLEQGGLPVPAVPTLMLAGSLATSALQLAGVWGAAIAASVIADLLWYVFGRLFGYRVLRGLCKISINPGSCVSQTEARFVRWGLKSLLVAKFIPGFSTVAPPIAGALRLALPGFLIASAAGAAIWSGAGLAAGWLLRAQVQAAISVLDQHAARALTAILVVVGLWISWKLWKKYEFRKLSLLPKITAEELFAALQTPNPPWMLDLRGATLIAQAGLVAGATVTDQSRLIQTVRAWPKDQSIVTFCACPEDASAIQAAHTLRQAGYHFVKPLAGGYQAWVECAKR